MFRRLLTLVSVGALCMSSFSVVAEGSKPSFSDYVNQLKQQAIAKGYDKAFIDEVFGQVKLFRRALASDKPQPEGRLTLETYLPKVVSQRKADKARALYKKHHIELQRIGEKYGVQPRFILAFWGVASEFGEVNRHYPVLSVVASLAYEGKREIFYKKEFFAALKILAQQDISFRDMKGSWKGEMGQAQVSPTFYLSYAQDGDGDGVKDIWTSTSDVFASIAFYLKEMGWNSEQTWGRQVKVSPSFDASVLGLGGSKSLADWQELGVRRYSGADLPISVPLQASLIAPDGKKGRYYLVYENYRSLLKWESSDYYAISVAHLSEKIKYPKIEVD